MAFTAVITSNSWHLTVVQSVAWINMYGDFRETMPAEEAFKAAMGGTQLCNLCEYVQNSSSAQEEQAEFLQKDKTNPLLLATPESSHLDHLPTISHQTEYQFVMFQRWEEREIPPPKLVLV